MVRSLHTIRVTLLFALLLSCGQLRPVAPNDRLAGPPLPAPPQSAALREGPGPSEVLYRALSQCGTPLSENDRRRIADVIAVESRRHGYDPLLVFAIVQTESTCRPTARSRAGAVGLMQIKPTVARAVADAAGMRWQGAHTLTRPAVNVPLGLRYLRQLEEQLGDPYRAMAAYNLGPGRVAKMSRHQARKVRYVRRVLARYDDLRERYS